MNQSTVQAIMRTIFFCLILLAACGCQKLAAPAAPKPISWEYKTVTVENFAGYQHHEASEEMQTNVDLGLKHWRSAEASSGSFMLEGGSGHYSVDLRELGRQGWELVTVAPEIETIPGAEAFHGQDFNRTTEKLEDGYTTFNNTRTARLTFIFKRPSQ